MLAKTKSFGLNGLNGYQINVEVDTHYALPSFTIVGLADTAIKESHERVRSAIKNSGFKYPTTRIVANLSPADTKKEGTLFDLPIAVALLGASEQISVNLIEEYVFLGELSLDGTLNAVNGVLPILISMQQQGLKKAIIPFGNQAESMFVSGVEIIAAKTFREVVDFLRGEVEILPSPKKQWQEISSDSGGNDIKYVKGQFVAKRALEIAIAGGHNILLIGPPGAGKTMMAKSALSILPDMTFDEALEVAKIHSVAGVLDKADGILTTRPFRSPHHTASVVALTGGGRNAKPGEISLAHNGILFLDELPEYTRQTLETLRQPLEDGQITVARAMQTVNYPASFVLIASMNPCPCGNYGSQVNECKCTASQIQKYLAKLSGPLLDRIDLHIEVDSISYDQLTSSDLAESSCEVKKRIDKARVVQQQRFGEGKVHSNSQMDSQQTLKYCNIDSRSQAMLENAFNKLKLSARAHNRILKVARTIADLDQSEQILSKHIAEAIQYRSLDRKFQV